MSRHEAFWSQREAAREYPRLASACEAVFAALGAQAPQVDPPAAVVAAAVLARQLGSHAAAWATLVPESVLLADERAAAPSCPPVEPTIPAVVAAIEALRADLDELLTRTTPIGDGAARRLASATLGDIDAALEPLRGAAAVAVR